MKNESWKKCKKSLKSPFCYLFLYEPCRILGSIQVWNKPAKIFMAHVIIQLNCAVPHGLFLHLQKKKMKQKKKKKKLLSLLQSLQISFTRYTIVC